MRIGFFTPRSLKPLHTRLLAFQNYFLERGHTVEFISYTSSTDSSIAARLNWIWLWFFDMNAVRKCKPRVKDFDCVFVCDLKYLPLVKECKRQNKFTIYDTIDHNVELRFYQLEQKIPFIKISKKPIINFFRRFEQKLANQSDAITVNSLSLQGYLGPKANLLFYSSPFESMQIQNNAKNPPAILYLGIFSKEKGAHEILALVKKLNIPLHVYGEVTSSDLINQLQSNQNITVSPRISSTELRSKIAELMNTQFLLGLSLIKPAHFSYEVQEANKDIDYLALSIPIIGNYRTTTRQKIEDGCGLFFDDPALAESIHDTGKLEAISKKCKETYNSIFHSKHFAEVLDKIIPS